MIRDQLLEDQLEIKWVATAQPIADALTKGAAAAFAYLKLAMETPLFSISHDDRREERLQAFKLEERALRYGHTARAKAGATRKPRTDLAPRPTRREARR